MKAKFEVSNLTGVCHGCSAEGALYHPHRDEKLCPKCSAYFDMCNMAHVNLEELAGPIIEEWLAFWSKRGLPQQEATEILDSFAARETPAYSWRE